MNIYLLGGCFILLVVVNIILGSISSLFNKKFDKAKLLKGVAKGSIIALCFLCFYYVGILIPDAVTINVGGQEVNLAIVATLLLVKGLKEYAEKVHHQLAKFINVTIGDN